MRSRPSEWSSSLRWIVTQSRSRSGSIASAHTASGGAAMSMLVSTSLMWARTVVQTAGTSSCRPVRGVVETAQRVLDRRVEAVQPDAAQLAGAVVAQEQVAAEAAHEGLDERRVLARDRGGDPARHGRQPQREVEPRPAEEQRVADALDHRGVGHDLGPP